MYVHLQFNQNKPLWHMQSCLIVCSFPNGGVETSFFPLPSVTFVCVSLGSCSLNNTFVFAVVCNEPPGSAVQPAPAFNKQFDKSILTTPSCYCRADINIRHNFTKPGKHDRNKRIHWQQAEYNQHKPIPLIYRITVICSENNKSISCLPFFKQPRIQVTCATCWKN